MLPSQKEIRNIPITIRERNRCLRPAHPLQATPNRTPRQSAIARNVFPPACSLGWGEGWVEGRTNRLDRATLFAPVAGSGPLCRRQSSIQSQRFKSLTIGTSPGVHREEGPAFPNQPVV